MKISFYFEQLQWADRTAVYIVAEDATGKRFIAKPMNLEFEPTDYSQKPASLELRGEQSREFFPALVDGLIRSGFRYEVKEVGELKATKAHLEDLRVISMKAIDHLLNMPTPAKDGEK